MAGFTKRVFRAAKLDIYLYEEVEADQNALPQAIGVVILSSLAAGIGSIHALGFAGIFSMTVGALFGWFIWALLTFLIGTKLLPEPQTSSSLGELLRTIGFSSAPGLIRVLGIIPYFGGIIFLVAALWMLVAMVIAVRQALDYKSTLRAIAVCGIGWLIQAIIIYIIHRIF